MNEREMRIQYKGNETRSLSLKNINNIQQYYYDLSHSGNLQDS
jgi:hypothetical protein